MASEILASPTEIIAEPRVYFSERPAYRLLSGSTNTYYQNTFEPSQRCLRIGRVGFHTHMAHLLVYFIYGYNSIILRKCNLNIFLSFRMGGGLTLLLAPPPGHTDTIPDLPDTPDKIKRKWTGLRHFSNFKPLHCTANEP